MIHFISLVLFSTIGSITAQPNLTTRDTFFSIQPNLTTPNIQPNLTTPKTVISKLQTEVTSPSTSITETVNEVLSGSIDGMIGETVDMLTSSSTDPKETSNKGSFDQEIPSSLALDPNNQTNEFVIPTETKLIGNVSNSTKNISTVLQSTNQSTNDSLNQLKQSFQRSIYNSTIAQSFDNNSLTKIRNENTFNSLIYKMKNILDTDLFK